MDVRHPRCALKMEWLAQLVSRWSPHFWHLQYPFGSCSIQTVCFCCQMSLHNVAARWDIDPRIALARRMRGWCPVPVQRCAHAQFRAFKNEQFVFFWQNRSLSWNHWKYSTSLMRGVLHLDGWLPRGYLWPDTAKLPCSVRWSYPGPCRGGPTISRMKHEDIFVESESWNSQLWQFTRGLGSLIQGVCYRKPSHFAIQKVRCVSDGFLRLIDGCEW